MLRRALESVTYTTVGPAVAAFSAVDTVEERLAALADGPVRRSPWRRAVTYAPGPIILAVLAVTAPLAGDAKHRLAVTGHCPT